jgi:Ca-activated chloride channel family protein
MKSLALLLAVIAAVVPSLGQSSKPEVQTVVLTVTNSAGQYVTNLKQDAFIVEEDGKPQRVETFREDPDLPVSLGILIDKSTSMRLPVATQGREKVSAALLAANGASRVVLRLTKPQDEFLFMVFDDKFDVRQSFTTDKKKITDLLTKNNAVGGATHLYNAVEEALKEIRKKAKNRRRALIVITDVHDTSGDSVDELQAVIREQEIPVYTFGMRWDAWGVPGEDAETAKSSYEESVLKMMAAYSGGYSAVVDIPDLLSDYTINRMIAFVQQIGVELRGQYLLSYTSTTPGPGAGKVIRVRTTTADHRVQVRRETAK